MKYDSTTDYEMFKLLPGNREVNQKGGYLKRLLNSIRAENLLSSNPILVNEKFQVIDGQHRLAAAQILKEPIYYTVSKGANMEDVYRLNSVRKNWQGIDFVRSYANGGNEEYQRLLDFSEKWDVTLPMAITMAGSSESTSSVPLIRRGEWKSNGWQQADRVAAMYKEISPYLNPLCRNSRALARAIKQYARLEVEFPKQRLFDKLAQSNAKIQPESTIQGYLRQFEDALNWHMPEGSHVRIY